MATPCIAQLVAAALIIPTSIAIHPVESEIDDSSAELVVTALQSAGVMEDGQSVKELSSGFSAQTLDPHFAISTEGVEGHETAIAVESGDSQFAVDGVRIFLQQDANAAYALTSVGDGLGAGYAVMLDETAPSSHEFEFSVDGEPAVLEEALDGYVEVLSQNGSRANLILPAWATDANMVALPTHYEVRGSKLIQHIETQGAAFPVVADPQLACDAAFCTAEYNRAATKTLANQLPGWTTAITAACLLRGPAGGASCGIAFGSASAVASGAYANGNCFGIRKLHYGGPPFPVEIARAESGYCR